MDQYSIKLISEHFNLGVPVKEPIAVFGGLLHKMWKLTTNSGLYAVKQLSNRINILDKNIVNNYELTENIARDFYKQGIPAIHAIGEPGNSVYIKDSTAYLVYPWIEAKALKEGEVIPDKAIQIAAIVAKMHKLNLQKNELTGVYFDTHQSSEIQNLADKLKESNILVDDFFVQLPPLLEANEIYLEAYKELESETVVSHGDLDQKNVLWDQNDDPFLVDWESARRINPTYELINLSLDWSGIQSDFNMILFKKMLQTYQESGAGLSYDLLQPALYCVIGNWINWMIFNMNRSLSVESDRNIGVQQTNQTLSTISKIIHLIPNLKEQLNL